MAAYKDEQLRKFNETPIEIGESVTIYVPETKTRREGRKIVEYIENKRVEGVVSEINGDSITVKTTRYLTDAFTVVDRSKVHRNEELYIGADPLIEKDWMQNMETTAFPLGSILGMLNIKRAGREFALDQDWIVDGVNINGYNDDPFVIDKDGNKQYYQRGYVWTEEQQKDLIRSIFNRLECGKIIVRRRDHNWVINEVKSGNTNARLFDVVDGKQRLNALKRYFNDELEVDGYYYTDLSEYARRKLEMLTPITYCAFKEKATDSDIIQAFLNVNYTGVLCSKEHIEYVKEINKKCKTYV